jgi:hypothetical protein
MVGNFFVKKFVHIPFPRVAHLVPFPLQSSPHSSLPPTAVNVSRRRSQFSSCLAAGEPSSPLPLLSPTPAPFPLSYCAGIHGRSSPGTTQNRLPLQDCGRAILPVAFLATVLH